MAVATASVTDDEPPLIVAPPPGPRSREIFATLGDLECPASSIRRKARAPASIVLERGVGSNLFDVDGNRYVDLAAGFGSAILGHGPSPAHDAVIAQAGVLAQGLGDLYATEIKVRLLERLASLHPAPGARVMLCQSGADAVTAAIKTAALFTSRPGLIAFEGAYHGLSYAPLAACGLREGFRAPFAAQLNPNVRFVPWPRDETEKDGVLDWIRAATAAGTIGAVLVEPVLGRGGVVVPPRGFLSALADIAREAGAIVIADEIWTGMGRSGHVLRSVAEGIEPDLVCLGKGLGASFPISACIGSARVMEAWARGGEVIHTSTHAGAPIGCAAALATLDTIASRGLLRRSRDLGAKLVKSLNRAGLRARGAGLLVGIEMPSGTGIVAAQRLLERGYVVTSGGASGDVIVVTPPLVIAERSLADFVPVMASVLRDVS